MTTALAVLQLFEDYPALQGLDPDDAWRMVEQARRGEGLKACDVAQLGWPDFLIGMVLLPRPGVRLTREQVDFTCPGDANLLFQLATRHANW